jgi:hypothetical protein
VTQAVASAASALLRFAAFARSSESGGGREALETCVPLGEPPHRRKIVEWGPSGPSNIHILT